MDADYTITAGLCAAVVSGTQVDRGQSETSWAWKGGEGEVAWIVKG